MRLIQVADAARYPRMTTEELRSAFLVDGLFQPGRIDLAYIDLDRTIVGSAVPVADPLTLETDPDLRAGYFNERREIGVLNIGGAGAVQVNGEAHPLATLDALYIGRGNEHIAFSSNDPASPAEFYLLSYPAHTAHPVARIDSASAEATVLGSAETANHRRIRRLIHLDGARSCQLVMGFTELSPGSVWNTMPPHLHDRRSEVYFYFGLGENDRVFHYMGEPDQTRHIVMANDEAVVSPPWSIHMGSGTAAYAFIWAMGGENLDYTDMRVLDICQLK
jgi:4-deoxy-L-threo-5-hexosulose-uronate ketol-isomerase